MYTQVSCLMQSSVRWCFLPTSTCSNIKWLTVLFSSCHSPWRAPTDHKHPEMSITELACPIKTLLLLRFKSLLTYLYLYQSPSTCHFKFDVCYRTTVFRLCQGKNSFTYEAFIKCTVCAWCVTPRNARHNNACFLIKVHFAWWKWYIK